MWSIKVGCIHTFVRIIVTFINNSKNVYYCYTCVWIFTYPRLRNVIMTTFSPVSFSTSRSRNVSWALSGVLLYDECDTRRVVHISATWFRKDKRLKTLTFFFVFRLGRNVEWLPPEVWVVSSLHYKYQVLSETHLLCRVSTSSEWPRIWL